MTHDERREAIVKLGIEYTAEFIPQSKSRNAGEKALSLNWRVTLKRAGADIVTDYMQGIGHHPTYQLAQKRGWLPTSLWLDEQYRTSVESGTYRTDPNAFYGGAKLPAPDLLDVLYSLTMDADAIDYSFDEWCANYGCDTDSRKAEATYNKCLAIAIKLRRMVGDEGLATLRAVFSDY